jgi:hypothetical protein
VSHDRLLEATRALRESRVGTSPTARLTEERVMARVARGTRSKRRIVWFLPIAAVLAVSSAWGAAQPELRALAREAWTRLTGESEAAPVARARRASNGNPPRTPAPSSMMKAELPEEQPAPLVREPPKKSLAPDQGVLKRSQGTRAATTAGAVTATETPAERPSATPPNGALELYQHAHELHFKRRLPEAALNAWDQYLAAAPSGPLALEARYNRAICLVQLGRRDEARAALAPFARGDYGGYRQAEAAAIMDGSGSLR